jgi:hypothetical protein
LCYGSGSYQLKFKQFVAIVERRQVSALLGIESFKYIHFYWNSTFWSDPNFHTVDTSYKHHLGPKNRCLYWGEVNFKGFLMLGTKKPGVCNESLPYDRKIRSKQHLNSAISTTWSTFITRQENPDIFSMQSKQIGFWSVLRNPYHCLGERNGNSAPVHFESVSTPSDF